MELIFTLGTVVVAAVISFKIGYRTGKNDGMKEVLDDFNKVLRKEIKGDLQE